MYFGKLPKTALMREKLFGSFTNKVPMNNPVYIARRDDADATEFLSELQTTDMAIGDATAEIMITTPGPIPNVMYDLEETTVNNAIEQRITPTTVSTLTTLTTEKIPTVQESDSHASLFTIITICLIILLLCCCGIACVIVRSKRQFSSSSDLDCDPECYGAKMPLIKSGKLSETTSKTSSSGRR